MNIVNYLNRLTPLVKSLWPVLPTLATFLAWESQAKDAFVTSISPLWQFRILLMLLATCLCSLTYIYLKRPKFIEHCGAHFKIKKDTYHHSVYCGDSKCLLPTFVNSDDLYECKCGWKSSFYTDEITKIASELPSP